MTEADLRAGRIRIPRSTKLALPQVRAMVRIRLRGRTLDVAYNPRVNPPPERSGVLSVGRADLGALVRADEILELAVDSAGLIELT